MKDSIRNKLESVRDRFEEISGLLSDPDVIGDQNQFRELSREYSRVEPIVALFNRFDLLSEEIAAAEEMANDADSDIRDMGQEELQGLMSQREALLLEIQPTDAIFRLALDLAHALAAQSHFLAGLLEGQRWLTLKSKSERDHGLLLRR